MNLEIYCSERLLGMHEKEARLLKCAAGDEAGAPGARPSSADADSPTRADEPIAPASADLIAYLADHILELQRLALRCGLANISNHLQKAYLEARAEIVATGER